MMPTGSHVKESRMNTERRAILHARPSLAARFRAGFSGAVIKKAHNHHR